MPIQRIRWGTNILIASIFLVVAVIPQIRRPVVASILWVTKPVAIIGNWSRNILTYPSTNYNDRQTVADLRKKISDLTTRLYETNERIEISQSYDKLQAISIQRKIPLVYGSVIASSPDPGILSFVINVGKKQGLKPGQAVINDQQSLIGKVMGVNDQTSSILLLADRQSVISARIQNADQSSGIIRGERGLSLVMDFIPKNDDLKNGQTVVTSGTDPGIPADLLIGTIRQISNHSSDLFRQATIDPVVPWTRIRTVGVVTID